MAGPYIYALGGSDTFSGGALTDVSVYDVGADTWYQPTSVPTARRAAASATYNGEIYLFGGFDANTNPLATVESYDVETDTWTTRTSIPTARGKLGHHYDTKNGYLYLMGGAKSKNNGDRLKVNERYDFATDTWDTTVADAPESASFPMCANRGDGYLWYLTGNSDNGTPGHVMRYDPSADSWNANYSAHPYNATDGAGVLHNDQFHFFGGWNPTTDTNYDDHYAYDFANDTWNHLSNMHVKWHHQAAASDGTDIYVLLGAQGGHGSSSMTTDCYKWDGTGWTQLNNGPLAKWNTSSTQYIPVGDGSPGWKVSSANLTETSQAQGGGTGLRELSNSLFTHTPAKNTVRYYPFEEGSGSTTYDLFGGDAGSIYNSNWTSEVRTAIECPGNSGNRVEAPFVIDPSSGDWTVGLAFRADALPSSVASDFILLAQKNGTGTGRTWINVDAADDTLKSYMGATTTSSGTTINTNQRYVVFLRYDSSAGSLDYIVDGAAANSASVTPEAADGAHVIGCHKDTTSNPHYGHIDEVMFANQYVSDSLISHHTSRLQNATLPTHLVDDYTDGGIGEYSGNTGQFSVATTGGYSGSNYLSGSSAGSAYEILSTTGLPNYPSSGDTIEWAMRPSNSSAVGHLMFGVQDSNNKYSATIHCNNGAIKLNKWVAGSWTGLASTAITVSNFVDVWSDCTLQWGTDGSFTFTVNNGTSSASVSASDTNFSSGGIGMNLKKNCTVDWDYVRYTP